MTMIRDAEKNILLLNQVRARAFEELEQTRKEKLVMQNQVKLLEIRLLEADAKVKRTSLEKEKLKLLELELEKSREKLAQTEADLKLLLDAKTERISDRESIQNRIEVVSSPQLLIRNSTFEEEVNSLNETLAAVKMKQDSLTRAETEKHYLQRKVENLETKLEESKKGDLEFEAQNIENKVLKAEVDRLQSQLTGFSAAKALRKGGPVLQRDRGTLDKGNLDGNRDIEALQQEIFELQAELGKGEEERNILQKAQMENRILKEQVKMLRERLSESDAEIRSQLESYQTELVFFQASVRKLQLQIKAGMVQVPVGEMPWEFWSSLILRIDAWILAKSISVEDGAELWLMVWQRDARIRDAYVALQEEKEEKLVIAGLIELINSRKRPGLYIINIAAEMAPVAKVGGLGDVVTGLGRALQKKGHLVEVILPKYDCMDYKRIKDLKVLDVDIRSYFDGQTFANKIWQGTVEGLPVYFIEPYHPAKFFWRGVFYGENDDFRRFTYFCRAALEFVLQSGKKPDIIHSHDWHTAAVAPLYWDIYVPKGLDSARLAFTCHNFEYQGTEAPAALAACGLNVQHQFRLDRMQDNFMHNRVNLLKGGIVFSNLVTTVSPTYAQEVRGPEGGRGLQISLAAHSNKFFGILNGIDYDAWNPATDPLLEYHFSSEDLLGKQKNKAFLRSRFGFSTGGPRSEKPLVGCVTRLVPQKGIHLIRHAIYRTLEKGGQFILLGSSPVPQIQREFEDIAKKFQAHPDARLVLKYDEKLSHLIYAASDIFVIPSIFEPCGLTQMISMRYGAIPVARKTGGLNDSVFDADDPTIPFESRNGFTFSSADEQDLNYALDRAVNYFLHRPESWRDLVKKTMKLDFSWDSSANQYVDLFKKAIARAVSRT
ncbi:hypothetical protein O6H91_06G048000 [Diphasiastrum complanatum]|nr:hypothetical protein O6H91_06G048000 [Diphasiastrum complanatum]